MKFSNTLLLAAATAALAMAVVPVDATFSFDVEGYDGKDDIGQPLASTSPETVRPIRKQNIRRSSGTAMAGSAAASQGGKPSTMSLKEQMEVLRAAPYMAALARYEKRVANQRAAEQESWRRHSMYANLHSVADSGYSYELSDDAYDEGFSVSVGAFGDDDGWDDAYEGVEFSFSDEADGDDGDDAWVDDYIAPDVYAFEPLEPASQAAANDRLVIQRDTGTLEFVPTLPATQFQTTVDIDGILGLVTLHSGDYLVVITGKRRVGALIPDHSHDVFAITRTALYPVAKSFAHLSPAQRIDEDAYVALLDRMCNLGHMYYSPSWDLTNTMQTNLSRDAAESAKPLWQLANTRYFWNHHLQSKLISLTQQDSRAHAFVLPVICGYVKITPAVIHHRAVQYALITRKRVHRVGTRYHSRGIDAQGHVANFCETEQVVTYHVPTERATHVRSYVQIRGSIPLFWRQKVNAKYVPILELVHKPTSEAVFARHVNEQFDTYGDSQVMVNLINKKGYELPLGEEFQRQVNLFNHPNLKYIHFDFHEECKKMRYDRISLLVDQIRPDVDHQKYFAATTSPQGTKIQHVQRGVVRTNCIDCLDRTNVVQSVLAKHVLVEQLVDLGVLRSGETVDPSSEFEKTFKNMWADNADVVSVLYSGTGALKTDYTRTGTRTNAGLLQDGYNSVVRYVKNNFLDGTRQDAYDLFLGNATIANGPYVAATRALTQEKGVLAAWSDAQKALVAVFLTAAVLMAMALLFVRETYTQFRVLVLAASIAVAGTAVLVNKRGIELVQLPKLVPLEYVVEREQAARYGPGKLKV
ncbi:hypothetical protein GGF31_005678 [Allomyces arbusculus]|nr:hypothetical protein GGF31_005678 [Allomyces arbusculus]